VNRNARRPHVLKFGVRTRGLAGEPALVDLYEQAVAQLGMKASALDLLAGTRTLFRLGGMLAAKEES
jgi:hypothetical protein